MIEVTRPFLPPKGEYEAYLNGIWERNWLTNNGPLVQELEVRLKEYLNSNDLLFVANGTIAIQLAIKALGLRGEIITTPFSYVATTSSIVWEGCVPVFVDIDAGSLNIDPEKIETAVTPKTSAILATHVYGNACDAERIDEVAKRRNLKVIYDAAHAFGTKYKGRSIFDFGDISTTSFHATKLFHSTEGGAVFAKDPNVLRRLKLMRNFGHNGPGKFDGVGINGKNSELHAAMGLCVLKYANLILERRRELFLYYDEVLRGLDLGHQVITTHCNYNYSYYPILFKTERDLLQAQSLLEEKHVYARRYFYPTLSSLDYVRKHRTPVADSIAQRILCLPLYHSLNHSDQDFIAGILFKAEIFANAKNFYPG